MKKLQQGSIFSGGLKHNSPGRQLVKRYVKNVIKTIIATLTLLAGLLYLLINSDFII
tara:strand:- start:215 stop:385 length:171 start_codon:yes stop_codon:yes gene_type:complete